MKQLTCSIVAIVAVTFTMSVDAHAQVEPSSALYFCTDWGKFVDPIFVDQFDVSVDGACVITGLSNDALSERVEVSPGIHEVEYRQHADEPCTGALKVTRRFDVGADETQLGFSGPNPQGRPILTAHSIDTRPLDHNRVRVSFLSSGEPETLVTKIKSRHRTIRKILRHGKQSRAVFLRPGRYIVEARAFDRGGASFEKFRAAVRIQAGAPQVIVLTGHEAFGAFSMLHLVFD